jgi:hypothetical protein
MPTSTLDYVNVSIWNMHLYYQPYGPYAACSALCDDPAQLIAGEMAVAMGGDGNKNTLMQKLRVSQVECKTSRPC